MKFRHSMSEANSRELGCEKLDNFRREQGDAVWYVLFPRLRFLFTSPGVLRLGRHAVSLGMSRLFTGVLLARFQEARETGLTIPSCRHRKPRRETPGLVKRTWAQIQDKPSLPSHSSFAQPSRELTAPGAASRYLAILRELLAPGYCVSHFLTINSGR